jgi:zinc finger CCCH domain-containing protein 13
MQTLHGRATGRPNSRSDSNHPVSSSRPSLSSKRSHDDFDRDHGGYDDRNRDRGDREKEKKIPTGPSAHRDKRRKSGEDKNSIANLFTAGLRKTAGKTRERRGGVKMEGDVERELERSERERERRW